MWLIGGKASKANVDLVQAWEHFEGGNDWAPNSQQAQPSLRNPLNTCKPEPGSHGVSGNPKCPIQFYPTWQEGLKATGLSIIHDYPKVQVAFQERVGPSAAAQEAHAHHVWVTILDYQTWTTSNFFAPWPQPTYAWKIQPTDRWSVA